MHLLDVGTSLLYTQVASDKWPEPMGKMVQAKLEPFLKSYAGALHCIILCVYCHVQKGCHDRFMLRHLATHSIQGSHGPDEHAWYSPAAMLSCQPLSHHPVLPLPAGTLFAEISHAIQSTPDSFADLFKRADMQRRGELPLLDVARVCGMLLPEGLVEVDSTYFQVRSHHSIDCMALRCSLGGQAIITRMLLCDD